MVNDATAERLQRLTAHRDGAVLSLFLDLDPSQFPTGADRQAAVDSLLHDARQELDARHDDLDHDQLKRLREALGEVERMLSPDDLPGEGARGLALFTPGSDGEEVELLRLPRSIPSRVVLDEAPYVHPLVPLAARERYCVALINSTEARFHLGDEDDLPQTGSFEDDVHGRHSAGGWAQRRYEESIKQEKLHHMDRAAKALRIALVERHLFDRLILVGQEQIRSTMEDRLDKQVRERLVGWTEVDMSAASEQDVREAVAPMIREHRLAREQEALERMVAGVAAESGHGVVGLAPTLQALNEYRVEILLLDPELHVPGGRCPQCEVLFIEGLRTCPADGEEIVELADVTRAAVAKALEQSADVLLSAPDPALADAGGIGAVTRF
jgi:peptide subunit release factor 1 (eRF1)